MSTEAERPETVAADDELSPGEKKAKHAEFVTWYDLVCGQCGRHCCVNCTANGNYSSCAQTRFTNCSVCGHASNGHYAAAH